MAERKILDESNDEYSEQNLVDLYNLAIKEIVNLVPSSSSETRTWRLSPTTQQNIPADAINLVDVISNMGSDGETPGAAIRETTLKVMKALLPGWESDPPAAIIENFFKIPESKTAFMVYPKSDGTGHIMADITILPAIVLWDAGEDWKVAVIGVDDTYSHAIINGMVYIAYDDDSDMPGNTPRSQMYYTRFLQDLGLRDQRMVTRKQRKIAGE
jgi:hypothetical protein